jgi:hypothetical protein
MDEVHQLVLLDGVIATLYIDLDKEKLRPTVALRQSMQPREAQKPSQVTVVNGK